MAGSAACLRAPIRTSSLPAFFPVIGSLLWSGANSDGRYSSPLGSSANDHFREFVFWIKSAVKPNPRCGRHKRRYGLLRGHVGFTQQLGRSQSDVGIGLLAGALLHQFQHLRLHGFAAGSQRAERVDWDGGVCVDCVVEFASHLQQFRHGGFGRRTNAAQSPRSKLPHILVFMIEQLRQWRNRIGSARPVLSQRNNRGIPLVQIFTIKILHQ